MTRSWSDWWRKRGDERRRANLRRQAVPTRGLGASRVHRHDRELLSFAGSDYLGLSRHSEVVGAVITCVEDDGLGERSAGLITGHHDEHEALVHDVAALVGAEDGLVFSSGWSANVGMLDGLGGDDLEIFSDALNHASLIDGCRLSKSRGTKTRVYPHGDLTALARLLEESSAPRKLIVSDTVFSMEGTLADVAGLHALAMEHEAMLHLDEAHATLVVGPAGGGVAEGLRDARILRTVTLGKAFGSQGAIILGASDVIDDLRQSLRSYVFSTGLALPMVAAARAALRMNREHREIRGRLDALRARAAELLSKPVPTPIIPIVLGDESAALEVSLELRERGFHVPAIRPPTVPQGTSRLRIVLSASMRDEDVDALFAALRDLEVI